MNKNKTMILKNTAVTNFLIKPYKINKVPAMHKEQYAFFQKALDQCNSPA